MGDRQGIEYLMSRDCEKITEVYLCHLSRRLNQNSGNTLLPLNVLLLTENPFSLFLKKYDIRFEKSDAGEIELLYQNRLIKWNEIKKPNFRPTRFSKRLNHDFCVNGFQFLHNIDHNTGANYNTYMRVPEFVQDLDFLLNIGLVQKYRDESSGYIALCKIPRQEILFDKECQMYGFDIRYLYNALWYIWEYNFAKIRSSVNPILRASDINSICVERWVKEEDICHD